MDMIERVATAIEEALNDNPPGDYYLNKQEHFRGLARAAIGAMREPTSAMVEALNPPSVPSDSRDYIVKDWHRMIDGALTAPAPNTGC